jgi:hypothetical protein
MAESNQDFDCVAGDIITLYFTIRDKDNHDALVDLTGASVTWRAVRGSTTLLTLNTSGVVTVNSSGLVTVPLSAANTTTLTGVGTHQAQATLASGAINTFALGSFVVHPTII